jgi:PAS domain S-box-containing protein
LAPNELDEEALLRSVAIQNARSILLARERAEEDLVKAKEALELRTRELESALQDLQYQFGLNRVIAENAASCLFMVDVRGSATYMNPAAKHVTGFDLRDFKNRSFHEVLHREYADGSPFPAEKCPIVSAWQGTVPLLGYRTVFLRKDDTQFPVSCSVSPLQRDGQPAGAVIEFRDITDELAAQRALEESSRRKDEFLATLSHELRTPMTAVLGWARMLKLGLSENEAREAIEAIEKSASIQARLIDDVLDVSRVTAGKLTLTPHPIDLAAVLHAALTTVHPAASAKNIEILSSISPVLPMVSGDEGRLQQVIWNLLANAVKFTPRGGTITVRLSQIGSNLRLTVHDTGKGIDPGFIPYVFEAFRQEDSSTTRSHSGIGLGLSIVKSLVELHGGSITAASDGRGRGATFTVELPVLESMSTVSGRSKRASPEPPPPEATDFPLMSGSTVLVIDDQAFTRDVVAAIFNRAKAEVHIASSVREGLEQFKAETPDIVICDIALPIEDGYAFVRAVRGMREPLRNTPIIALTAFGRPEDRQRALDSGFDAYLKKPVEPVELISTALRIATARR